MDFLDGLGQEVSAVDSDRSRRDLEADEHLLPKGKETPAAAAAAAAIIAAPQRKDILHCFPRFCQKFRVQALTLYGLVAAGGVLGTKGVSVLLLHLGLCFSVAQLRKPVLSWACSLTLLSTLYIQPLQDVQVGVNHSFSVIVEGTIKLKI